MANRTTFWTMRKERVNRRDAPALCMLFGGILLFLAVSLLYGWRLDLARPGELLQVSGQIEAVEATNRPKAGRKLHIYVSSPDGVRHLTLDDLTSAVPNLGTLRRGEIVDALVKADSFGRDLYWLWELRRGNEAILTYEESLHFLMQRAERVRPIGHAVAIVVSLLFVAGALLRWRFGAWSSSGRKTKIREGGVRSME